MYVTSFDPSFYKDLLCKNKSKTYNLLQRNCCSWKQKGNKSYKRIKEFECLLNLVRFWKVYLMWARQMTFDNGWYKNMFVFSLDLKCYLNRKCHLREFYLLFLIKESLFINRLPLSRRWISICTSCMRYQKATPLPTMSITSSSI